MAFTKIGGYSGPAAAKPSGVRAQVGSTSAAVAGSAVSKPPRTTGSYRPVKPLAGNGGGESNSKK